MSHLPAVTIGTQCLFFRFPTWKDLNALTSVMGAAAKRTRGSRVLKENAATGLINQCSKLGANMARGQIFVLSGYEWVPQ